MSCVQGACRSWPTPQACLKARSTGQALKALRSSTSWSTHALARLAFWLRQCFRPATMGCANDDRQTRCPARPHSKHCSCMQASMSGKDGTRGSGLQGKLLGKVGKKIESELSKRFGGVSSLSSLGALRSALQIQCPSRARMFRLTSGLAMLVSVRGAAVPICSRCCRSVRSRVKCRARGSHMCTPADEHIWPAWRRAGPWIPGLRRSEQQHHVQCIRTARAGAVWQRDAARRHGPIVWGALCSACWLSWARRHEQQQRIQRIWRAWARAVWEPAAARQHKQPLAWRRRCAGRAHGSSEWLPWARRPRLAASLPGRSPARWPRR